MAERRRLPSVIGICTDSNAQFPPPLAERFGVEVVPVTVRIGDHEYLEGVDLDADSFYARFAGGEIDGAELATCPPSPGQFALAYERLAERGATEILSIHVGSALSGSLSSARLAARQSPVPVRLVDTGAASFGVGGCTWAAAEAVAAGATLDQAAATAEALGPHVGNVFVLRAADVLKMRCPSSDAPVPVLSYLNGQVTVVDRVGCLEDAVTRMADFAHRWRPCEGCRLNVAIAIADRSCEPLADALAAALRSGRAIHDLVQYRIGPSVGTQTGPAAVGAFFYRV